MMLGFMTKILVEHHVNGCIIIHGLDPVPRLLWLLLTSTAESTSAIFQTNACSSSASTTPASIPTAAFFCLPLRGQRHLFSIRRRPGRGTDRTRHGFSTGSGNARTWMTRWGLSFLTVSIGSHEDNRVHIVTDTASRSSVGIDAGTGRTLPCRARISGVTPGCRPCFLSFVAGRFLPFTGC
jgi:hypothetical protein